MTLFLKESKILCMCTHTHVLMLPKRASACWYCFLFLFDLFFNLVKKKKICNLHIKRKEKKLYYHRVKAYRNKKMREN